MGKLANTVEMASMDAEMRVSHVWEEREGTMCGMASEFCMG